MQQLADAELASAALRTSRFPYRYVIVALFFLSTVICYIDRVNVSVAIIPMARDRGYDAATQGLILSSFFWGYLLSQLAGGWVADRFGGKRVLAVGVATWSIATVLTPPATASLGLLLAVRALLGIGEGVNFPAIHSLAAKWTKTSERARAVALNFTGVHLGTVLALLLSPPVILRFGWRALFYCSGLLGFIWLVPWVLKSANRPEDSTRISRFECEEIASDRSAITPPAAVPWRRIFSEPAVWAIALAHTCNNWGLYILLLWLPTYLNKILGVPLAHVGAYSLIPWLATFFAGNLGGWYGDHLIARGLTVTYV
ncbi:MAG TPA: MFS transporter, partial [Candidatus Binataceae bacterium]